MKLSILVADDDPLIRTLIAVSVADMAETTQAGDGDEALNLFEQGKFDLAMIDRDMPGRNGLEVIQAIRSTCSEIPIIMVTAEARREQVLQAIQAGASDYVLKPCNGDVLREKLKKFCSKAASHSCVETDGRGSQ